MFGCLIIDKPRGITSHDIISKLRKSLNTRRIGHAGTLDPLATGVVVVGVGQATRFLNFLPTEPKVYEGQALFGITTDTYDQEGKIVSTKEVPTNYYQILQKLIPSFTGKILQRPPIYSALKKNGKPLYDYARRGVEIEINPRQVEIHSLEIGNEQNNVVNFRVSCSGGTYIRSLVHDLGESLGCGAYLTALKRTAVGDFKLDQALSLEDVTSDKLLSLENVLLKHKKRILTELEIEKIKNGQRIVRFDEDPIQILVNNKGEILSLSRVEEDFLQPFCVVNRD